MLKKFLKMAMTFVVLVAAYGGYSRGFAFLASHIARPRTVPVLPTVATQTQSLKDAIALAVSAFGPDHWAVKAELHYIEVARGYWIYFRNQERLDDGKKWEVSPVAVIVQSSKGKGRELKTITGLKARITFNRPFDVTQPGDEPAHVTHALIQGDVRIRVDKGTPSIADDLVIGPQDSLEFDEKRAQITSQGDERIVLVEKGTTVIGLGLTMDLRRNSLVSDPWDTVVEGSPPPAQRAGFEGVKTIILHREVTVDVENVSQSGIVPGGSQVVATATKDGKKTPVKTEPRPGHIQAAGPMRIEMPRKRVQPRIGPPAPPEPTFAYFDRNVRLQQGTGADLDQLDCDHFEALLLPPEPGEGEKARAARDTEPKKKSTAADTLADGPATKGQAKADPADEPAEESGGSVSNLTLRRAKATGHAVWFQSTAQHMVAYGNYLRYEKFGGEAPDCIYFYGDKYTEVVQTNVFTTGKEIGKPRSIETIRTKDITIYRYPEGGPAPSIAMRGPGTQETRPAGSDVVERFSSWQDQANSFIEPGTDLRRVILLGHPRVSSATQGGDMTADKQIDFYLEPKDKAQPDDKAKVRVVAKDGKPVAPTAKSAVAKDEPQPASGDSMKIKKVRGVGNVLLVTKETLPDPTATPPKKGDSRKEMRARDVFTAKFVDVPADPAPPPVAAKPEEPKPAEAEPAEVAQADPYKVAPLPAPEPPMTAIADTVDAIVLRKAGSESSQLSDATLTGRAEIHQDPKEGKTVGSDLTGATILIKNRGENDLWVKALGTPIEWATAITDGRNLKGPIIYLHQAVDHLWVEGWGRFETEQGETDLLDGSAPVGNEVASSEDDAKGKAKDKEVVPKKKKGPLVINWGTGPDDKAAKMHFYGRTTNPDGSPGPAQAIFYSHVRARTDDSKGDCEELTATFNAPIPFVKAKPSSEKSGEKATKAEIATIRFFKNADVTARQIDPETGFLKDKKHIIRDDVFYEKATGKFTGKDGPGEVFLYSTSSDDKDQDKDGAAPGPMASDRRTVKPTSARVEDPKAKPKARKVPTEQPQLTLTHVLFQKQMSGRFTPPKDAKPGDYNFVYFNGSVETMMAKVKDEYATLDPDNPPDDFYRLVSREMTVNIEPPPVKGQDTKDRILLDAWGDPVAQTRQKTIKGDQITYDSLSELTYVYGGSHGVDITNQDGAGQPHTNGRGDTVMHNHKTGETKVINPKTFAVIQPNTGVRSALVPIQATPRRVDGLAAPTRPNKVRDPYDPALKARQLRLPPRSDKERRGFSGR